MVMDDFPSLGLYHTCTNTTKRHVGDTRERVSYKKPLFAAIPCFINGLFQEINSISVVAKCAERQQKG